MEVNVEVAERQTGTFQVGAGFSSVENFIVQAQISQNNLFGRGQSLTLQAQLSGIRQLFLLSLRRSVLPRHQLDLRLQPLQPVPVLPVVQPHLEGRQPHLGLHARRRLPPLPHATSSRTWGSATTAGTACSSGGQRTPFPAGTLANLLRAGLTSSVRALARLRHARQPPLPHSGWYNTASAEFAEPVLFSRDTSSPATTRLLRYYYPIWGPFVLRLNGRLGPRHQPRSAGRAHLRALLRRRHLRRPRLPPLHARPAASGRPTSRRRTPSLDTLEHRRQHAGHRQRPRSSSRSSRRSASAAVIFSDVGNAYNLEDQYCRLRPRHVARRRSTPACTSRLRQPAPSWGFGFRWFSPIGPLRFEWGLPFKPLPGEEPLIFEFTIGNYLVRSRGPAGPPVAIEGRTRPTAAGVLSIGVQKGEVRHS